MSQQKNVVKHITDKICLSYKKIKYRRLKNKSFSIISNNCIGGFLYKQYGSKFYSPTIGLQFSQEDFVKLCKNLEYYLNEELIESDDKMQDGFTKLGGGTIDFPVGKLADITIYFQHYPSFEEAKEKWNKRKNYIDENNLFFIFVGYDNTPLEVFEEYDKLPFKHKLLLTNEKIINSNDTFAMHNGNRRWLDKINHKFGIKYYEQFNFYKWFVERINGNENRNNVI